MPLAAMQGAFTEMVADLIDYAKAMGYRLRWGDAFRSTDKLKCPGCQQKYSYQDLLIFNGRSADPHSKHLDRLAVDFIVEHHDGTPMLPADYEVLGSFWEREGGTWGGRWANKDLGHFQYGQVARVPTVDV